MTRLLVAGAALCLLLLALPAASAAGPDKPDLPDADRLCYGYPVGWEGYQQWCVHPNDPHCLVEYTWANIGEVWTYCYGI